MNKESQIQFIINELINNGYVDNINCINNHILRLGARIYDIRKKLYKFALIKTQGRIDYTKLLITDERHDSDKNTHYYASKRCIQYLKKLNK